LAVRPQEKPRSVQLSSIAVILPQRMPLALVAPVAFSVTMVTAASKGLATRRISSNRSRVVAS